MADVSLKVLETERRYVARELHDGVAQTTQQLGLQVAICQKMLERGKVELLAGELAELERRVQLASSQVRDLINDMRPPQVEPHADLLEYLQYTVDTHVQRGGPPVEVLLQAAEPLPEFSPLFLLALVRIVQEALLNIRKHARASRVRLVLVEDNDNLCITIGDNGPDFDPAELEGHFSDRASAGLANLYARAELIGGKASVERKTNGDWTEVKLVLPR
jgi:signal transduction histidine kinase